jgi:hypothetical protein
LGEACRIRIARVVIGQEELKKRSKLSNASVALGISGCFVSNKSIKGMYLKWPGRYYSSSIETVC